MNPRILHSCGSIYQIGTGINMEPEKICRINNTGIGQKESQFTIPLFEARPSTTPVAIRLQRGQSRAAPLALAMVKYTPSGFGVLRLYTSIPHVGLARPKRELAQVHHT